MGEGVVVPAHRLQRRANEGVISIFVVPEIAVPYALIDMGVQDFQYTPERGAPVQGWTGLAEFGADAAANSWQNREICSDFGMNCPWADYSWLTN